jgi:hypothetical protein
MVNYTDMKVVRRKLGKEKADGLAHIDDNTIEIDERLKGKYRLEITIHEALHILYPTDSETAIIRKSKRLTNVLWKQGYRLIEK